MTPEEVIARFRLYEKTDDKLSAHLYEFGLKMLEDQRRRSDKLETKANILIAGVVTASGFLFAHQADLSFGARWAALAVTVLLLGSGWLAFRVARVKPWMIFSPKGWLPDREDRRDSAGMIRYHAYLAHHVHSGNEGIVRKMGSTLAWAQGLALLAVFLLAVIATSEAFRPARASLSRPPNPSPVLHPAQTLTN